MGAFLLCAQCRDLNLHVRKSNCGICISWLKYGIFMHMKSLLTVLPCEHRRLFALLYVTGVQTVLYEAERPPRQTP